MRNSFFDERTAASGRLMYLHNTLASACQSAVDR